MVSEQECYNALILSRVGFFHLPAILKLLDMMGVGHGSGGTQ